MFDTITDIFTDAFVLLPLLIVFVVVVGLISWAVNFFSHDRSAARAKFLVK
jgi:hypothetical protein